MDSGRSIEGFNIVNKCIQLSVVGFFLMMSTGCATIVNGSNQTIPVASEPDNADVTVDGMLLGQTPIDIKVKRKFNHLVVIEKKGFAPKTIPVTKSIGGAVWGNILAGGLIGWGVDASTGAQYKLSPNVISVKLEAATSENIGTQNDSSGSEFVTKLNQLDSMVESKTISKDNYLKERCQLFKEYFPTTKPDDSCVEESGQQEEADQQQEE